MNKKSVFVAFSGCKVNQFEKNLLAEKFINEGFKITNKIEEAEYIVYNTCCVTEKAEQGCRRDIRKFHRTNPAAKIVITGCYGEKSKKEIQQMDGVFTVISNAQKEIIPEILSNKTPEYSDSLNYKYFRLHKDKSRAFLKIQDGCDAFCSYCIVPYVRGNPRSMPLEIVLENLTNLSCEHEVVLSGIHLGKWGKDMGLSFEKLMLEISKRGFPFRIRLSSLEATELTDELLYILKEMDNFCHHFHVPLQSGSDKILKLMNRNYDTNYFKNKIEKIRTLFNHACIGTDIIVGFPGENDNDFNDSKFFVETLPIDYLHIFTYSKRDGTEASYFKDEISRETAHNRMMILKEIDNKKRKCFIENFLDKEILCIADKGLPNGYFRAVSREYLKVIIKGFPPKSEFRAKIVDTKLPEAIILQ